jgi:hypothetical protein
VPAFWDISSETACLHVTTIRFHPLKKHDDNEIDAENSTAIHDDFQRTPITVNSVDST